MVDAPAMALEFYLPIWCVGAWTDIGQSLDGRTMRYVAGVGGELRRIGGRPKKSKGREVVPEIEVWSCSGMCSGRYIGVETSGARHPGLLGTAVGLCSASHAGRGMGTTRVRFEENPILCLSIIIATGVRLATMTTINPACSL